MTRDSQSVIQSSLASPPDGYRVALQLARLLLTGANIDPESGQGGESFTIPLARIWESAVTQMCRDLSPHTAWQVTSRADSIRLWDDAKEAGKAYRSMIADTLLHRGNERWVLDAKYKRSYGNESRIDRFQMCAYAVGFQASRTTLVYPTVNNQSSLDRTLLKTTFGNLPVKVNAIALPMDKGPSECKAGLRKLLTE